MGLDIEARTYPVYECGNCEIGDGIAIVMYGVDTDTHQHYWRGRAICMCCGDLGFERLVKVNGVTPENLEKALLRMERKACTTLWNDFMTSPKDRGAAPVQVPDPIISTWNVDELFAEHKPEEAPRKDTSEDPEDWSAQLQDN